MTKLKEGAQAPAFTGKDEQGNEISLSDFKGKKLILFFYPQDNTPTCTKEACNLRDNHQKLKEAGFQIVGVSPDSERKHQNFIKKHSLSFPLIADTNREVIEAYDVWGPKKSFGKEYDGLRRTTFVIDEEGKISRIFTKVKAADHAGQILESYN